MIKKNIKWILCLGTLVLGEMPTDFLLAHCNTENISLEQDYNKKLEQNIRNEWAGKELSEKNQDFFKKIGQKLSIDCSNIKFYEPHKHLLEIQPLANFGYFIKEDSCILVIENWFDNLPESAREFCAAKLLSNFSHYNTKLSIIKPYLHLISLIGLQTATGYSLYKYLKKNPHIFGLRLSNNIQKFIAISAGTISWRLLWPFLKKHYDEYKTFAHNKKIAAQFGGIDGACLLFGDMLKKINERPSNEQTYWIQVKPILEKSLKQLEQLKNKNK